jgi:hypothetical protein
MAEAKANFEWEQTSSLMALICNIVRDPKKSKPITSDAFNPYAKTKAKAKIPKVPITILKDVFVTNNKERKSCH